MFSTPLLDPINVDREHRLPVCPAHRVDECSRAGDRDLDKCHSALEKEDSRKE